MDQVESLCAVIQEEARVCGLLTGLLRDEQRAVVELRPQAILSCLEQRQMLHDELSRLAAQRRELIREVANAGGGNAPSMTALLPLLPAASRERMRAGIRSLRGALLEARGLERQNELLIGGGLETVSELLRALRALVPGARYGADAQLAPGTAVDRLDRRV